MLRDYAEASAEAGDSNEIEFIGSWSRKPGESDLRPENPFTGESLLAVTSWRLVDRVDTVRVIPHEGQLFHARTLSRAQALLQDLRSDEDHRKSPGRVEGSADDGPRSKIRLLNEWVISFALIGEGAFSDH